MTNSNRAVQGALLKGKIIPSLRKIAKLGHPKMQQGTEPVSSEKWHLQEIQRLVDDVIETMRDANGVGMAEPQVRQRRGTKRRA